MTKVLSTLWFRLTKSKMLIVLLALVAGMALIDIGLYTMLPYILSGEEMGSLEAVMDLSDMFSLTVTSVARSDSYASMITVIFVALFLGADFSEGTIRNAILSNKSRWQIFGAYLVVATGACLVFVGVQTAVYLVYLACSNGFADYTTAQVVSGIFSAVGSGFVSCLLMATTALFVLVGTQKKVLAIILPLALNMVCATAFEIVVTLGQMLGSSLGFLQWIPFAQQMFFDAGAVEGALLGKILLVNGLLAIGEGACGYFVFAKAQLK